MPKKSSSKTQAPKPKDPIIEQEKSTSTPKKTSHEIDEIFSSKKRKKPEQQKVENQTEDVIKSSKTKKKQKRNKVPKENGFLDPPSRPRKKTGDGLAIYSEEELGVAKADAGGTPLCPFDCSCCF